MPDSAGRPHPHLRLDRDGAVLTLTLDNAARRNAQVPSLWAALTGIAGDLPDGVRVVLLRGASTSFSAGLDRRLLTPGGLPGEDDALGGSGSGRADEERIAGYQRAFAAWRECPALVVAAVQGHAVGAGFQLALAADLRVVADDVSFVMPEVSLGLVPDLGGTWQLARLVGPARALELCLSARPVRAPEAVALGLAQLAVPASELDSAAHDLIDAVLQAPEPAVRELVGLLRTASEHTFAEQLVAERTAQARLLAGAATGRG